MDAATKTELGVGSSVTFTCHFEVPRALVFRAWTDPLLLARWWGPQCFTNPVCEFEARPGGRIYIEMMGSDGTVYPMGGEVLEIIAPERLVFTTTACEDAKGVPGLKAIDTVIFREYGERTEIDLESRVVEATPEVTGALAGMEPGWAQSLERLAETVHALYSE